MKLVTMEEIGSIVSRGITAKELGLQIGVTEMRVTNRIRNLSANKVNK